MILPAIPAAAAAFYYLLVIAAAARWRSHEKAAAVGTPISILKPVHGRDPGFYEAIRSHAQQRYPEFEILFGVSDPDDAAIADIRKLQRDFPSRRIELHVIETAAPNVKAGVLDGLARHARYPIVLVNDSDIRVDPDYLSLVAAPLGDPKIGVVTCLYRAAAESAASRAEALGIATEFAPSVLVARLLGQVEFVLGSTMALRADTLREIGGFAAIDDYIADDYQLGRHVTKRGYRVEFAPAVVETNLGDESWAQVWRHQLRWSRTIRVSRPAGYYGYVITHATIWAIAAAAAGQWQIAATTLAIRVLAGVWTGAAILRDRKTFRYLWLIPLRDLFGFAVWFVGIFGDKVEWRGQRLKLSPDGRITDYTGKLDPINHP